MFFAQFRLEVRPTINMVKYLHAYDRGHSGFALSRTENESSARETFSEGTDCAWGRNGSRSNEQKKEAADSSATDTFEKAGDPRD